MTNREIAISFLKLASSGDIDSAYERFVAKHFIHHNQYFKGDRESLKQGMILAHKSTPNKEIDIKKCYADGDIIVTHSHVSRATPGGADIAVIHIFRFEDKKIVELWDSGQVMDKNSPNENGFF